MGIIKMSIKMNEFSEDKTLEILGARENNLKNIDLSMPRNALVVVTGICSKSSISVCNEPSRATVNSTTPFFSLIPTRL